MSDIHAACPKCGSKETHHRKSRGDWVCDDCENVWKLSSDAIAQETSAAAKPCLFLSYGRDRDGKALADRLCVDLAAHGFDVWRDTREIVAGQSWQHEITDGLRKAQVVLYLMTPHSTRVSTNRDSHDQVDSVCLGEIAYALFHPPPRPVVPVLAARGAEPPLAIFHLDYVDLQAWKQSDDQYQAGLRRLLDGIAAALRGEKRYRKWHHQLNPWDFAALLNEKRTDFCGREWLFDEIDAWRAAQQERALLITGDPGVGKSALVAQLVFLNPGGQVLAYHCCQADTPETLRPARFVRSVAAMIAGKLPEYAARLDEPTVQEALSVGRCEQDPASAFEEGVLAQLEHVPAPADGVRYLLIDALDEALTHRGAGRTIVDLLASRLGRLPGWLRIVATTRKEPAVVDRLRGLRARELTTNEKENQKDLDLFLRRLLSRPNWAERLTASGLAEQSVRQTLRTKSAGNFLYAKQALEGIERDQYSFVRLDELPPGLSGLYRDFFRRCFPDQASYTKARHVLEVVVAARENLTAEQIACATGLELEYEFPRVVRPLASYLPQKDGYYAIYHKSFADWLTSGREENEYYVSEKRGHARLVDYCLHWKDLPEGGQVYALLFGPRHLHAVGRTREALQFLINLPRHHLLATMKMEENDRSVLAVLPETPVEQVQPRLVLIGSAESGLTAYWLALLESMRHVESQMDITLNRTEDFVNVDDIRCKLRHPVFGWLRRLRKGTYYDCWLAPVTGRREYFDVKDIEVSSRFLANASALLWTVDAGKLLDDRRGRDHTELLSSVIHRLIAVLGHAGELASGATICKPLAVVLTKCDLIGIRDTLGEIWHLPLQNPRRYDSRLARKVNDLVVQQLLVRGMSNLIGLVQQQFAQVSFFAVSTKGPPRPREETLPFGIVPYRVEEPLLWILHEWGYL